MKKILCPIDSTQASDRLVRYVSNIAKDTESKIYLLALEASKKERVMAGAFENKSSRLDELHDYVNSVMQVPCGIDEEQVGHSYKKLGLIADHYDIMAMSITSSKPNKIMATGYDLIKVIQDTLAPLLIIPDHFVYTQIGRLLYAYDYKHEPEPPLLQLTWLSEWFGVDVKFVTVLPSNISKAEEARIIDLQNKVKASWTSKRAIDFEANICSDVSKCLEKYLNIRLSNDLLILSVNHQNLLERIWHKSVVKGLLHNAMHPYLIVHK